MSMVGQPLMHEPQRVGGDELVVDANGGAIIALQ